jgi:hypothetical protein
MPLNLPPFEHSSDNNAPEEKLRPSYMYENVNLDRLMHSGTKIFGEPGASLTWGIGGHKNVSTSMGENGEKETGEILNQYVSSVNNAYVCHSVKSTLNQGDIDHILIQDNIIVIIDSKKWKGSRKYSIGDKYNIIRGRTSFPEGYIKAGEIRAKMQEKFPNHKIKYVVCIAQTKIFVVKNNNWYKAPYKLIELEKLESFLQQNLAAETRQPDLNTVKHFASMCVSAYSIRDKIIKNPDLMF